MQRVCQRVARQHRPRGDGRRRTAWGHQNAGERRGVARQRHRAHCAYHDCHVRCVQPPRGADAVQLAGRARNAEASGRWQAAAVDKGGARHQGRSGARGGVLIVIATQAQPERHHNLVLHACRLLVIQQLPGGPLRHRRRHRRILQHRQHVFTGGAHRRARHGGSHRTRRVRHLACQRHACRCNVRWPFPRLGSLSTTCSCGLWRRLRHCLVAVTAVAMLTFAAITTVAAAATRSATVTTCIGVRLSAAGRSRAWRDMAAQVASSTQLLADAGPPRRGCSIFRVTLVHQVQQLVHAGTQAHPGRAVLVPEPRVCRLGVRGIQRGVCDSRSRCRSGGARRRDAYCKPQGLLGRHDPRRDAQQGGYRRQPGGLQDPCKGARHLQRQDDGQVHQHGVHRQVGGHLPVRDADLGGEDDVRGAAGRLPQHAGNHGDRVQPRCHCRSKCSQAGGHGGRDAQQLKHGRRRSTHKGWHVCKCMRGGRHRHHKRVARGCRCSRRGGVVGRLGGQAYLPQRGHRRVARH